MWKDPKILAKECIITIYNDLTGSDVSFSSATKAQMRAILIHFINNKKQYTGALRNASEKAGLHKTHLLNVVSHTFLGGYGYFDEFTNLQKLVTSELPKSGLPKGAEKTEVVKWVNNLVSKQPAKTAAILRQLYLSTIYSFCYSRLQSRDSAEWGEQKSEETTITEAPSELQNESTKDMDFLQQVVNVFEMIK